MPESQPPTPDDHAPESFTGDSPALDNAAAEHPAVEGVEGEFAAFGETIEVIGVTVNEAIAPLPAADVPAAEWDLVDAELTAPPPAATAAAPPRPTPTAQSQTLQTFQQFWQRTQPKLTVGTIRVLKTVIQLLERTVSRLETGLPPAPPAAETPLPLPDGVSEVGQTLRQWGQQLWRSWRSMLPTIRRKLPTAVNDVLASDRALSGAIAGVLILVLVITNSLFSSKPPEQVAIAPPPKAAPAKPVLEKKAPPAQKLPEVKVIPPPVAKPTPTPESPPPPQPTVSPTPTPPPIAAPTTLPSPAPTPTPPPLKLTPEQTLIARIQDQVGEVSDQYVNGLIQSVQANFRSSRLMVKVGSGWYTLLPAQQDSLANDVLKRAQQLNFVKLELVDESGILIARSPVIGSEMVVLARSVPLSAQTAKAEGGGQTAEGME